MISGFVAAIVFVGLGVAVFWPEYPPLEPGFHRAPSRREMRAAVLTDELQEPEPEPDQYGIPEHPDTRTWRWSANQGRHRRASHRYDDLIRLTEPIRWYDSPGAENSPPMYPS